MTPTELDRIRVAAREAAEHAPLPSPDELPELRRVFAPLRGMLAELNQRKIA